MKFFKSIFRGLFAEEITTLQKQVQSKQKALAEKEWALKKLRGDKKKLESKVTSYQESISNMESQMIMLRKTLSAKEEEVSEKKRRISILSSRLTQKEEEATKYNEQKNDYCSQIEQLKSDKSQLEGCILSQSQMIKNKEVLIQKLEHERNAFKEEVGALNSKTSTLEEQVREANLKITKAQKTLSEKENDLNEKSELLLSNGNQLEELNKYKRDLEVEVNRLNNLLSEGNSKLENLTSKNEALVSEKQKLEKDLLNLQGHSVDEKVVCALKNDIKQKQDTITLLEGDIQHLNEELSSIRNEKEESDRRLNEKSKECASLTQELRSIGTRADRVQSTERALDQAEHRIGELENSLKNAPSINELLRRDKEIERLKKKIHEYEMKLSESATPVYSEQNPASQQSVPSSSEKEIRSESHSKGNSEQNAPRQRGVYRKPKYPYRKKPIAPSKDVVTVDFPVIENDNVYSQTARLIDRVFNHRSNSYILADDIFLHKSVEEISRMRFELEEATRTGIPYLTCPCCGNMVKISSRSVGFGLKNRDVQYFTHAVKNMPCDLKRDNSYTVNIADGYKDEKDYSYLEELRNLLTNSLRTELSKNKGVSLVEDCVYIHSDDLPIMKRRQADVTATYKDMNLVFELVTPNTHVARVHDRDIFYLINHRQVFWVFGAESIVDYNELRRSVSKDIFFTNKRNVFVFDIEAQEASKLRGELMLKCNWLDENGEWYYQFERDGKNGILISLDQIHFEHDGCRPYFYDADEPYYLKHPSAERPLKLSREKLKEDIIESWKYDQQRKRATEQMYRDNQGVEAYYDNKKWGFKYGDIVFIEPIFDSKPIMVADFAKVEKDGKFGVVNRFGDYRLKAEYEKVELIPNGYIMYAYKDKWYLYGVVESLSSFASDDEVKITTISQQSSIYHLIIKKSLYKNQQPEELYFIGNEIFKRNNTTGKWSLWQSNGEKVTDITWDTLEFTPDDTIKVSVNGRTQLLALDGTVIDEQKYKSESTLKNGYQIVETFDNYWGIIEDNGREKVSPKYDAIIAINDNYLKFRKNNRWGIMTISGDIISEPRYLSVDNFDGEYFEVTQPNEIRGWGTLSGKIDVAGNPVYEVISQGDNRCYITKSFEKYGLEKEGNVLIPHIYDSLFYWGEDKYIAQKDGKFGLIDSQNKVLLNFEYSSITPLKDGRSTIKKGTSQNVIDRNLKIVEDVIIELQEGFKKIKLGGKWGILNPKGEIIVDYLYDEITTFRGRLIGIINERLVKLNTYYPFRLAMKAKNLGLVDGRDLFDACGVQFQSFNRRKNPIKGKEETVSLINWTSSMKYPIVLLYDKDKHNKRAKHLDKPTDFTIGDTFEVTVKSIIKGYGVAKGKRKGVEIALSNGMKSYLFKKDFKDSGIDIATVNVGDSFNVTKLGYDEELDRTQWKVKKIDD